MKSLFFELCKKAGVSRTTFYSRFKNKEDLLDSLLLMFERAMLADNNARSLSKTGTFRFLPILLNHVNGNRKLFAKTNSTISGYPVAIRFEKMISKLVKTEIEEAQGLKIRIAQFSISLLEASITYWLNGVRPRRMQLT